VADSAPTLPVAFASKANGSLAVTSSQQNSVSGSYGLISMGPAAAFDTILGNDPQNYNRLYVGTGAVLTTPTITAAGTRRVASYWGGGTAGNIVDGVSNTTAASPSTGATVDRLMLGGYFGSPILPGIYKQVCVDTSPTRCR
jgi:hypothetical protein